MDEFEKLVRRDNGKKNHDDILNELKYIITNKSSDNHKWDTKAIDSLVMKYEIKILKI